jgi:hypothetical protein
MRKRKESQVTTNSRLGGTLPDEEYSRRDQVWRKIERNSVWGMLVQSHLSDG